MRGSIIIEKILDVLQGGAEVTVGISDAILSGSYRKLKAGRPFGFGTDWAEVFRDRQRFYSLLSYLKKQGLVENKKEGRGSLWKITKRGLEKLHILRERNRYSKESATYKEGKAEGGLKIVAYDIPAEGNQKRRDWLRWALLNMGFTMLQKSVWVGKNKIPEEFVKDLRERRLLPYVQIFEVSNRGTLKEIV